MLDKYSTSINDLLSQNDLLADFIGLPPLTKVQFLIGDLGYSLSISIGDCIDIKCKRFLNELFNLRSQAGDNYIL